MKKIMYAKNKKELKAEITKAINKRGDSVN